MILSWTLVVAKKRTGTEKRVAWSIHPLSRCSTRCWLTWRATPVENLYRSAQLIRLAWPLQFAFSGALLFGLLLDANKPVMPEARQSDLSRLTNTEMKRINIESSYALARWMENDAIRITGGGTTRLLGAAQRLLPLPQKSVKRAKAFLPIAGLAYQEVAQVVLDSRLDSPLGQEAISEAGKGPISGFGECSHQCCLA